VCRIDPIIPFVTDKQEDLEALVRRVVDAGAGHIITSCMDVPLVLKNELYVELSRRFGVPKKEFASLYTETISGRIHASIEYRRKLFSTMRAICDENKVTMGLCMEFASVGGKKVRGLNAEFMSSNNCEGINIPLYIRKGDGQRFEPVRGCNGNCLRCYHSEKEPVCGIPDLKKAGAWKLKDYRRWSKGITKSKQRKLEDAEIWSE